MSLSAKELVEKVEEFKNSGLSTNDACKEVGITPTIFYSRKSYLKKKKKPARKKKTFREIIEVPMVARDLSRLRLLLSLVNEEAERLSA